MNVESTTPIVRSTNTRAGTERHLSPEELADRLGVTVPTIYEWNYSGYGPRYMKVGRHCRYRLADVEKWEAERLVEPAGGNRAKAG